jgi:hypothetical protein
MTSYNTFDANIQCEENGAVSEAEYDRANAWEEKAGVDFTRCGSENSLSGFL